MSNLNAHVTSNMLGGMKASDRTITGIQSRSSEPQTRSSGARNREKGGGEETALPPSWTPPGGASPMPQKEKDSIFGGSFEIKTTESGLSMAHHPRSGCTVVTPPGADPTPRCTDAPAPHMCHTSYPCSFHMHCTWLRGANHALLQARLRRCARVPP